MLVAGDTNPAVQELWTTTARRGFTDRDGRRRIQDLAGGLVEVQVDGQRRYMIYPGQDARVLRIIKKVVRGLAHYHRVETAIPESRITADVLKFKIPDVVSRSIQYQHREADISQYWYDSPKHDEFSSIWLLKFFERRSFIAFVSHVEGSR